MLQTKIYNKRFNEITKRDELWSILSKNFFQKFIKKTDTVLDIASGYGEFINNIKCKKKIALDINPDSEKFLKKDINFILARSTNIPLNKEEVDKVFISNFFEHITREEIIKTIQEIKRILKKNGTVIILQPNIRFCNRDYWMFFDHITPIDDRALIEIFEVYGFKNTLRIEKFLPFTTKSKLPQSDIFIKIYLKLPFLWKIFGAQSLLIFKKS